MRYHSIAFLVGFLLDLCLGDPHWLYHPIRLVGAWIAWLEKKLHKEETPRNEKKERTEGTYLVFAVLLVTGLCVVGILTFAYLLHPAVGVIVESVMTYQILATKCLKVESMRVYTCLKKGDLPAARQAVSMIVGRDTANLDETGVAKAAIETVAENTSDGVIAPMLYTALFGPILGFLYKAVNTMDSMVGYKNDKYLFFGRTAAKLDDVVNYIPARISAWLLIVAASFPDREFSGREAYRIFRRDRYQHASPNSAQTEAACAGALGIQLAGDAYYFGKKVEKPYIGDAIRPVEAEDIRRVNRLMYRAAWICEIACLAVMAAIIVVSL
jgi:adenosylcobinamide-phosphate synthase